MALSNLTVKATYSADGANTTFAIPADIIVDDSAEVKVYIRDESVTPATQSLQSEGSLNDYTLTGAVLPGDFHTNVEFNTAPANGLKVIVTRELPLTQTLNLVTSFNRAAVNTAFDRVVAMIQQLNEKISRTPALQITEQVSDQLSLEEPQDGYVLYWDGTEIKSNDISVLYAAGAGLLAAVNNLSDLDDTETALTNLGIQPWRSWVEHSITAGQSATDLSGETWVSADNSSVEYSFEIIRGTTINANGSFSAQKQNGSWQIALGPYRGNIHGVTFSLSGTTTQQLRAAVGAGDNGTIKLSRRFIPE